MMGFERTTPLRHVSVSFGPTPPLIQPRGEGDQGRVGHLHKEGQQEDLVDRGWQGFTIWPKRYVGPHKIIPQSVHLYSSYDLHHI